MSRIEGKTAAAIGMAIGLCGLGVLSLAYQDFALQWEPVPKSLPGHDALGAASGVLRVRVWAFAMCRSWCASFMRLQRWRTSRAYEQR